MKNLKKMMMLSLALVLVLTSAVPAFAEEGTAPELSEVMIDAGSEDVIACEADESIGIMEEASPADAECADEALVGADEQPQEPVEYVYVNVAGNIEKKTCTSYIEINSETVEPAGGYKFDNGWYVVKGEVTFRERIQTSGNRSYLILTDGCVFNVPKGIENTIGHQLEIYGQELSTGTLNIDDVEDENAGIGGGTRSTSGIVYIYGGTINVTGGYGGAGIGAPYGASSQQVAIFGGVVTATGGYRAAGIGGGYVKDGSACTFNLIEITGGKVTATGGYEGTGIGAGFYCNLGGIIEITDGEVSATGGHRRAGIGGMAGHTIDINIYGGYVEATGGEGATAFRDYDDGGKAPILTLGTGVTLYVGASRKRVSGVTDIKIYDFKDPYARTTLRPNIVLSVRFETNGGSMMFPQAVKYGESAKKPKDPTKEGFEFSGWYSDAALTVPYDFASPVFENTTLYAKWKTVRVPDDSEDESEPFFTGTPEKPVSNGAWMQNTDGTWTYVTTRKFTDTWGYIANPWNDNKPAWFRFDGNGKMLTGWQMINWNGSCKFFYFREAADGRRGECLIDGVTPDGYTVNKDGAWTVDGVVQEYVPAAASVGTGSGPASAWSSSDNAGGLVAVTIPSSLSAAEFVIKTPEERDVRVIQGFSLKPGQGTTAGATVIKDSAASTITKAAESPLHEIDNAGAKDEMPKPQVIEPSDKQHIVIQ